MIEPPGELYIPNPTRVLSGKLLNICLMALLVCCKRVCVEPETLVSILPDVSTIRRTFAWLDVSSLVPT